MSKESKKQSYKCSSKEHENIEAIYYCQKCETYMCNKCENFHSKLCQNHQTFKINSDIKEIFTGYCKEKDHFSTLDYFCKNHNVLCCAECIIKIKRSGKGQHSNCEVYNIEDIINEKKNKLKENISILEKTSNEYSNNNLMAIFEKINKNKEEIKLKVQKIFTKIRNILNNREDELLLEIEKIYQNLTFNENIVKESENLSKNINISLQKGKTIFNEWNNNDKKENNLKNIINDCIILENNIKKINEIKINIEKAKINCNNEIEFIPKEDNEINLFIEKINTFGKIKFIYNYMQKTPIDNTHNNGEIIKSEISEEEKMDPDNIKYLNTLNVLNFKIQKYETISKNIDGRTPRELMQKIIKMRCKKKNLYESLGSQIGCEDYLNLLRYNYSHDQKLLEYFKNNKEQEKMELVNERLPLITKEIQELLAQMNINKNKK